MQRLIRRELTWVCRRPTRKIECYQNNREVHILGTSRLYTAKIEVNEWFAYLQSARLEFFV